MTNKTTPASGRIVFLSIMLCAVASLALFIAGGKATSDQSATIHTYALKTVSGREIQIRKYIPQSTCDSCANILFSHGAFSSPQAYDSILLPLAEAGFTAYAPMHVDSTLHPETGTYPPESQTALRVEDFAVILDAIADNDADGKEIDWIAAGHSFGALIAQIYGGAVISSASLDQDTPRPQKVIAISPPGAVDQFIPAESFASIDRPMMVITGTDDIVEMIAPKWQDHLISHEMAGDDLSVALVFTGVDHYFNGLYGRPIDRPRLAIDDALVSAIIAYAKGDDPKVVASSFLHKSDDDKLEDN